MVAALVYGLFAARILFAGEPTLVALAMVLVMVAFTMASWGALRDLVSGVFVKVGQVCRVGDHVRIEQTSGRVARMGLRVMVIETSDGDEAIIPYAKISKSRLTRTPPEDGVSPHVFRIALEGASAAELRTRIRRSALLCHWSAAAREPEVIVTGDHLEVTVYGVDPIRGPDIEKAVRTALGRERAIKAPVRAWGPAKTAPQRR